MNLTDEQVSAIRRWAEKTPYVVEVRLYGSRAKQTSRLDSDIDLALTLGGDPNTALANYFALGQKWQEALTAVVGLPVHVGLYNDPEASMVRTGCGHSSVVLFSRLNS